MNKRKTSLLTAVILVLSLMMQFLVSCTVSESPANAEKLEPLTVSVLKIGKADSIVLKTGENCLVIDAGEEDDGEELVEFLTKNSISRVNALIITHHDKDHVGGADTLVERFPVDRVILPDYEGVVTDYFEFMDALEAAKITPEKISENVEFDLGTAHVLIEAPSVYPELIAGMEIDNDCSLITTVTHGKNRLVFMGDAEKTRIRDWLSAGNAEKCDFMKVPHHGVYNAALSELFATTRPKYAVICSSDKNPAESKTLELIKSFGTEVYETRFGRLTVVSDGLTLELKQKTK
ncbi:MAG: MBL fold metallo-hydrolase [Clostridia bacterium]|nr:MBL fold metallo-hydrolase [Clostridia bacterium]